MTLKPYKIRGVLRLKIQPSRGLCRNLTLRRRGKLSFSMKDNCSPRGNKPKAVIWDGKHWNLPPLVYNHCFPPCSPAGSSKAIMTSFPRAIIHATFDPAIFWPWHFWYAMALQSIDLIRNGPYVHWFDTQWPLCPLIWYAMVLQSIDLICVMSTIEDLLPWLR